MAEDTRKPPSPPARSPNDPIPDSEAPWRERIQNQEIPKGQLGKLWEEFGNPDKPANEMPGGTYNSAGGKPKPVTWKDAFTFQKADFANFYKMSCARDALLVGLVAGFVVGGATGVWGGMRIARRAANLGVAGFATAAGGQYAWCESRRKEEGKSMAMAVVGMRKLQEKKDAEEQAEKAKTAAAEAEKVAARERERREGGWKFW